MLPEMLAPFPLLRKVMSWGRHFGLWDRSQYVEKSKINPPVSPGQATSELLMEIHFYLVWSDLFRGCLSQRLSLDPKRNVSIYALYNCKSKHTLKSYKADYIPQEKHERQRNLPLLVERTQAEPHSYQATARAKTESACWVLHLALKVFL